VINLRKLLKLFIAILLVLIPSQTIRAQALIKLRSTLSTGGSSKTFTSNGQQYYLQQSIGQSSVTGLSQNKDYLLRQGFIQPLKGSIKTIAAETLPVTLFPNPFSTHIIVSFTGEVSEILYITLYDLNGKIVFLNKYGAAQQLNLDVSALPPAIYFIRVNTPTRYFYSKMIKL
jgi:hypothetical protein